MRKQERAREFTIEREANLFRLAEYGSVSDMEAALREGIRLDTLDVAYRRTATMVAAGSNSADVLRAILKATEDPKNELRITSPVRPMEMPPSAPAALSPRVMRPTRRVVAQGGHASGSQPLGARGAGRFHGAALGCHEQQRRKGCSRGQAAAPVERRRVASEHGG